MIEDELRIAWKKHYLSSLDGRTLFSADYWKEMAVVLRGWADFSAYWLIPYKANVSAIASALRGCAIASVAILVVFAAIVMRLRRRYPSLSAARHSLPFCLYMALGLPLMVAGATTAMPPFSTVTFLAEILLAGGLVSLGWNLRRLSADDRATYKHNPLWQYWVGDILRRSACAALSF